jgi:SNF2 family DNA or RNA helicase
MTLDAMEEGFSVVVFMNFKESLRETAALLDCNYIDGSVKQEDRDEYIRRFQADEDNCLVVNAATGGTGISLHDTHGNRPRLSLISPSFNAKEFAQVIGRIHRNGAKSDALQRVMLASGSVEEKVMQIIADKLRAMDSIHQLNICTLTSNTYI